MGSGGNERRCVARTGLLQSEEPCPPPIGQTRGVVRPVTVCHGVCLTRGLGNRRARACPSQSERNQLRILHPGRLSRDPDMTTILSVTSRSLLVFHGRATAAHHPELIAVHLLPGDVDPSQTAVDAVNGSLQCICQNSATKGGSSSRRFQGEHRVPSYSTTSVPVIFLWPTPQKSEQRNWKVPALSGLNSTVAVIPLLIC